MTHDYTFSAQAMRLYGGAFFKAIGEAWCRADAKNRQRLEYAFKPEFDQYNSLGIREAA